MAKSSASKLERLYDAWVAEHERRGGDRSVQIALGPSKGLSEPGLHARGVSRLDLIGGSIDVMIRGLSDEVSWDVWVVDRRSRGASLVSADDEQLMLGTLTRVQDSWRMRAKLPASLLDGTLEVDVVAVTRAGAPPTERAALYGMPTTFQRLYSKKRLGQLGTYKTELSALQEVDSPKASFLHPAEARAASAQGRTVVTPAVLFSPLVALGAELFFNEQFEGNGRTCGSCHPASNNFTIDPDFIAKLPDDDPLFVAENNPELSELENSLLLRKFALILENVDGFDRPGVLRSVQHTLALSQSLEMPTCVDPDGCTVLATDPPLHFDVGDQTAFIDLSTPEMSGFEPLAPGIAYPVERTGWSGDGSPGSGSLREFAIGAVIQHLPKTLDRVPGVDFRLPTDEELDALELFQLSLGRSEDPDLRKLTFTDPEVELGMEIFLTNDTQNGTVQAGKCEICHQNAGANSTPEVFGDIVERFGFPRGLRGNMVLATGVGDIDPNPIEEFAPGQAPRDGGFGVRSLGPGDCLPGNFDISGPFPVFVPAPGKEPGGFGSTGVAPFFVPDACLENFNTPPLVEAADTAPFFHNNAAATLEEAIDFYNLPAFNDSSATQLFIASVDSGKIGISINELSVKRIGKFLRVLNSLENLRQSRELDEAALEAPTKGSARQLIEQAVFELEDARKVLVEVGLHPAAAAHINSAIMMNSVARVMPFRSTPWRKLLKQADVAMVKAHDAMVIEAP